MERWAQGLRLQRRIEPEEHFGSSFSISKSWHPFLFTNSPPPPSALRLCCHDCSEVEGWEATQPGSDAWREVGRNPKNTTAERSLEPGPGPQPSSQCEDSWSSEVIHWLGRQLGTHHPERSSARDAHPMHRNWTCLLLSSHGQQLPSPRPCAAKKVLCVCWDEGDIIKSYSPRPASRCTRKGSKMWLGQRQVLPAAPKTHSPPSSDALPGKGNVPFPLLQRGQARRCPGLPRFCWQAWQVPAQPRRQAPWLRRGQKGLRRNGRACARGDAPLTKPAEHHLLSASVLYCQPVTARCHRSRRGFNWTDLIPVPEQQVL